MDFGDGFVAVEDHMGFVIVAVDGGLGVPDPMIPGHPEFAVVVPEGFDLVEAPGFNIALGDGELKGFVILWRDATAEESDEGQGHYEGLKIFKHIKPSS
jgi:hypothetical protein